MVCCHQSQIMAAQSHYLNHCSFIIHRVGPVSFTWSQYIALDINAHGSNHYNAWENYAFKMTPPPRAQWLSDAVTICVSKLTIIGSDNGLSPDRRQAIIWTNARILLIGPWGTISSENVIGIKTVSFKKMHLKMSWPHCVKDQCHW